jgi:Flp pilus assembly protein TadD/TolB-like protein
MAGLLEEIQRRRLPHWLVAYLAAAWGCTEATGFLIANYGAPQRLLDVVLFLLVVFLFISLVIVWYHGERGPQRPTRAETTLLSVLFCVAVAGTVWITTVDASPGVSAVPEGIAAVDLGERSLVVLPFRSTVGDPELSWLDRGIPELLSTKLAQVADLRVLSSQRLADLLSRLGVGPDDAIPGAIRPRLLELAGARLAVTGSVFGHPGDLTITASLTDAATGEIRASGSVRGDDVMDLVDEIAAVLRGGIGGVGDLADLPSIASLTTGSVDAYRAYESGLRATHRFLRAEAADHFGEALALDSTFALARFRRALSLYQLGRMSEAAREARRARLELGDASERDRLFVEAFDGFATDTATAVSLVRELVRKYPDDKDARIIFASILAGLRGAADPEARTLVTETLRLDPAYGPGYNILAYSYAGSGNLDIADSLSQRYVQLEPDQPNSWDTRGEILEIAGRVGEARQAYRTALRTRPDFRLAINHLARSYLLMDDPAGARQEMAVLQESPLPSVRIRARALEADAWLWEGAVDEALAAYESAERDADTLGLSDLRVWRLRDVVRMDLALGRYGPAIEAASTIRGLEPVDGWWITALYDSLLAAGDVAEMERWKPRVEAQIRDNPLTRDNLAVITRLIDLWIAYARGDHEAVVAIASELPVALRPGVLTGWPVFQSMLALGRTEELMEALHDQRWPPLFVRGPRFEPLRIRWAQYFEARAREASGDGEAAEAAYEALVRAMGEGLARFPLLSDTRARLAALRTTEAPAVLVLHSSRGF